MIITALQRKGNNVVIIFDDSEPVTIDYRTVLDNGLRKNDTIDEKFFEQLISESSFLKIKDTAFRLLGRRHHSTLELRNKLVKKKYQKAIIEKVLTDLTEKKLLDDEQFAVAYLEERSVKKKIGINKLKAELFKKGIDRKIIDKILLNVDSDLSYEQAFELAKRKCLFLQRKDLDKAKLKSKIFLFLNSRGFESELIMKVLNDLNLENE
ncbi:MAG: regulatory protein RecX [Ignavibacteriales bacterium]|nr:regulatory protein RecX [Ignavibacteriales bacterium]